MTKEEIKNKLEYLRGELRAERLSYGEIVELQNLAQYIDPSDTELREAAGIPEWEREFDEWAKDSVADFRDEDGEEHNIYFIGLEGYKDLKEKIKQIIEKE